MNDLKQSFRSVCNKLLQGSVVPSHEILGLLNDLLTDSRIMRSRIIWHSLGFINVNLFSHQSMDLRLHVWMPNERSEQEQEWKIHDHVYKFTSQVLVGNISDHCFTVLPSETGKCRIHFVEYQDMGSVLHRQDGLCDLSEPRIEMVSAQQVYSVAQGQFHCSKVPSDSLTATLMATDQRNLRPIARVVGSRNGPLRITREVVSAQLDVESLIGSVIDHMSLPALLRAS